MMLRSVSAPRLAPFAWAAACGALFAHSDAIVRLMRTVGPFSIGLLEAISLLAWTLAVLGCLIAIERQYRVLGAVLLGSAAVGATATGSGQRYHVDNVPAWELSAHILLSMAAAALLFAADGCPRTGHVPADRRRLCAAHARAVHRLRVR